MGHAEIGRRLRPVGLGLLMALSSASCGPPPAPPPAGPGVSRELARFRKATVDSLRYDVRLDVPAQVSSPVTGTVTVSFRRDDPKERAVVLDFRRPEQRIEEVRVGGREVSPKYVNDHLVLPADAFPARGPVEILVRFRAGDEALNRSDDYLYTLFVPDRAHSAIPVFDQPDLKGRLALRLRVPEGWRTISNGRNLDEAGGADAPTGAGGPGSSPDPKASGPPGPDGRRTVRFAETEPLPPYLFAFAAGRFRLETAERQGRRLEFLHRETDSSKVARNLPAIFDLHAAALDRLEAYTGIPYPFGKVGFVGLPAFQFGGMEQPGAVYYRAGSLFLDESATQSQYLGRASVIAHETSHMWFGDLVTMDWFDDVWMKEVFANFLAAKIVNPSFPDLDHDLRFFVSHFPAAYRVDRSQGANPVRQPLENLSDAASLYGPIIYDKAPVVMRQLEAMVGEDGFRDGVREYLDAHRYGNASWPDLIRILDRKTPQDLAAWSRVWVEEPGRPTVRAELKEGREGRIGSLIVEQDDPAGRGRLWPQELNVVLGYGRDSTVALPVRLTERTAPVEAARGMGTPDFVLPGGRGMGYGRFRLDPLSRQWLLRRLTRIHDPVVRGVGWVTLWDGVLEGQLDPERFLGLLLRGCRSEDTELNAQRVLDYLQTTWWSLLDDRGRRRWAHRVETTLWRGVVSSGSRTMVAAFFQAYADVAVTPDGVERLRLVWAGRRDVPALPLSTRDYTDLAAQLALRGVEGTEEILDTQLGRIENPDRRDRFLFVRPALSPDPEVRRRFFRSLRDPANRRREPWVVDAVSYLNHPLRQEQARAFVLPSLELLEQIQETGDIFFPQRWLDATLRGHDTPEAADVVRRFLAERPDYPPRLRQKILQSADLLFRSARIVYGDRGGETQ